MSNNGMCLMQLLEAEWFYERKYVTETLPQEGKVPGKVAKWIPIISSPAAYQMSTCRA